MTNTFKTETLKALTLALIQADADSLRFQPVRTGKHNRSYWVEAEDTNAHHEKERFVLRIAPPDDAGFLFYERLMMRQEPELHTLIRLETDIPVAEVVGYDFSRAHIDRDYLLMRALPGTPISEIYGMTQARHNRALYQVGTYLRDLHALTATEHYGQRAYGYLGAHRPMTPQATWAEAFRVMWNALLDDVVACGSYTPEEGQRFRDLFDRHYAIFDRSVTPSLLHMDVWSQNILIDEAGNVTGLVDFDRALWGDVEIEFAVLDYCGISEPAFWEGYGRPRDTSPEAQIRQIFYLLYEVQKYMPIQVWRRNDPTGALRYKRHSFVLAERLA
jgi:fructosamine-3-kinase